MPRARAGALLGAALAAVALTGCGRDEPDRPRAAAARLEPGAHAGAPRLVLSAEAASRIGVRTAPVGRGRGGALTIPDSAVLYAPGGGAFAFTNPAPLTYVRRAIRIVRVDGDRAVLARGPATGTRVVTVGADELLGAETGIGKE